MLENGVYLPPSQFDIARHFSVVGVRIFILTNYRFRSRSRNSQFAFAFDVFAEARNRLSSGFNVFDDRISLRVFVHIIERLNDLIGVPARLNCRKRRRIASKTRRRFSTVFVPRS
jgi:hypothetical protein